MIILMSREVVDGETVGAGALSPIPAAACILAHETHAPNARVIILGSQEYFPFTAGTSQFHFLAQQGKLDLFFISGIQIDGEGNFNLHVLGDYRSPDLRMPGAYGTAMLYYVAKRVILFRTEHTRRSLVPRVDFITGAGATPGSVHRRGGPSKLITSMATFVFRQSPPGWLLQSVHPGYGLKDVLRSMSFRPAYEEPVPETLGPVEEELVTLRGVVKEKLGRIYSEFAATKIGQGYPGAIGPGGCSSGSTSSP